MALMERFGAHGLIWANEWKPDDAERTIASATCDQLHHVEIPLFDPWSLDVSATRELLDQHDLAATGSLALSRATDVSSEDLSIVADGERQVTKALEAAAALGCQYLCGVYYSALQRYEQPATSRGRNNSISLMRSVGQQAKELGVTLVLEVVNRYETNLLNTADDALRYIDETGLNNIRVHLDTYHMNMEEENMALPVRECGDRLGYVHLRESNSGYLGTGTVNFDEFIVALRDAKYNGLVTFEAFTYSRASADIRSLLCVWKDTWTDPDDLVAHARDFITAHEEANAAPVRTRANSEHV
jgi:D-psicose/D-tagatose/L-ribulose 3-epimerase